MNDLIIADAGPLIGLARTNHLWLLRRLYRSLVIPPAVQSELEIDALRPGSKALSIAFKDGWLSIAEPPKGKDRERLAEVLDAGEAEAILLARARNARLLIDEKRGRGVARRLGVIVIGTGAVLLVAKRARVVEQIAPILDQLADNGYRFSDQLRNDLLRMAGEE